MKINLGDKVKDSVTGFTGIAVARTTWLHGCDRITIQPEKLSKEGKVVDNNTFDEMQLVLVKANAIKSTREGANKTNRIAGGPQNDRSALMRN